MFQTVLSARLPVRLAAAGLVLATLSVLWVPLGPLYAQALDAVLSVFTSRELAIETRDQSIYLVASEFPGSERQTNIHFHAYLLSYGYLVAVGLFITEAVTSRRGPLSVLAVSSAALLIAHLVGLYVVGSFTLDWMRGEKTADDVNGAVTTLTMAWALVPAGVWTFAFLRGQLASQGRPRKSGLGGRRARRA